MTNAQYRFRPMLVTLIASVLLAACGDSGGGAPEFTQEEIAALRERSQAFAGQDAQALAANAQAHELGRELANAHCGSCHGLDGTDPSRGLPDLATGVFDYGDSPADIRTTIVSGRQSVMPPLGGQMGEVEVGALVALVQSFSGGKEPTTFADTAKRLYQEHCVVCHGPEGKGNALVGAPDLTDDHWLYGDSMMNIRLNITRGLDVKTPAFGDTLTEAEIELLTAYVLGLRH